ncbi:esterase family protein, partial [Draconibacterium sp.]|nr:esterase family protein [Draconibacterium sp.]
MKLITSLPQLFVQILLVIVLSGITFFSSAQGKVKNLKFYCNSLQMERNIQIYLPDGYNGKDSDRYPVIYF